MRYVILEHRQVGAVHWDFMLEQPGGWLRTWALDDLPASSGWRLARELPPHRAVYLKYQGPISGSRGWVTRWDEGRYRDCEDRLDLVRGGDLGDRLRDLALLVLRQDLVAEGDALIADVDGRPGDELPDGILRLAAKGAAQVAVVGHQELTSGGASGVRTIGVRVLLASGGSMAFG